MHAHTWTARAQLHLEREREKTKAKRAVYEEFREVMSLLDDLEGGTINRAQARSRARQVGINV